MSSLFDLMIRHRDSILYKIEHQKLAVTEAHEAVSRLEANLDKSYEDLAEVKRALDELYGEEEDAETVERPQSEPALDMG